MRLFIHLPIFCLFLWGIAIPAVGDPLEDFNPVTPLEDPGEILNLLDELESESPDSDDVGYLLHPANTSSPRDTTVSFLKLTQRFYDLISDESYSSKERVEVFHLFGQMQEFFDLRGVAPSLQKDYASASAIYLREIIDRVGLPLLEDIPDERMMSKAIKDGFPARWQLPGMPFEIIRIDSGEDEGHYVFSSETLMEVKPLFSEIRHLPYRTDKAKDFYYYFFLTPNPVIPSALIDNLPSWALADFYEQTVWQWLSMLIVLLAAVLSVLLLRMLIKRIANGKADLVRHSLFLIPPGYTIVVCYISHDLIDDKIFITGDVFQVVVYVIYAIILMCAIILIFMLGTIVADIVTGSKRLHQSFDSQLTRIGIRILSIVVCLAILIQGLHHIGFSLATVIAGAGVTGLAVALAAQSTLRNVFGSLMILLDKPFRVGQRIKVGATDGVVEEIGLRSTKIRLLTGHVTSIPNERMADAEIENIGQRPYIRRLTNITITYGTPIPKVRRAVEIIREILSVPEDFIAEVGNQHPNACINHPDFRPRVAFNEFNPDSLNILMIYWHFPPDYWESMAFTQRINETIMKRFEEEGIEFAFPTQTIHLAGEKVTPFPNIEAESNGPANETTSS
ncbi:mechanosensitive ion channel family protein [Cerasicoccus arenae]|uniref:Low conductance mechanosensitive channel YnaI n=1 Tax=Cerasicoccus arenae TaxID=424488 RepID=A0A8J3DKI1_9BACT|nr:mechanosensitive ion channel family protein [Cerasicoccus arenae]MBK1858959.1 mechanosensitive ion channel family protein [Cerasicoccus arenae]GHC04096.1 hypothetical protein GCM10007047_20940 [Cerasicoccus arenae]